jgi:hypothetical protein
MKTTHALVLCALLGALALAAAEVSPDEIKRKAILMSFDALLPAVSVEHAGSPTSSYVPALLCLPAALNVVSFIKRM